MRLIEQCLPAPRTADPCFTHKQAGWTAAAGGLSSKQPRAGAGRRGSPLRDPNRTVSPGPQLQSNCVLSSLEDEARAAAAAEHSGGPQ